MGGCPPDPEMGDGDHTQSESDREREAKRAEIVKEGGLKCLSSVAASSSLDSLLTQDNLSALHFKIPKSEAVDYVSTPEDTTPGSLEDCKVGFYSVFLPNEWETFLSHTMVAPKKIPSTDAGWY